MHINNKYISNAPKTKTPGFTLIELMITIAILGIIASIALPSYSKYVKRGNRSEGRSMLVDAAAKQERFYSDNNQFTATIGSTGMGITESANCTAAGIQSETCLYTITAAVSNSNQQFTLTATPTFPDSECTTLTLTQDGTKGATGTLGTTDCWGK